MKCKECKEHISDKVKYCPECGALVNDVKYNINDMSRFSPVIPKNDFNDRKSYVPQYDPAYRKTPISEPKSFSGRKKPRIFPIMTLGFIIVVFLTMFVFMNVVDEFKYADTLFDEQEFFEQEFSDAESVAFDYVDNIVDSDCMQSTESFRIHSMIDWDLVFRDYLKVDSSVEAAIPADVTDNYDSLYGTPEDIMQHSFDVLNSRFSDDFIPYYFYVSLDSSAVLSDSEIQYYTDKIAESFKTAGLDVLDYYEPAQISEMQKFRFFVSAENEECTETEDFGMIEVIAAEIYDDYYILYDDNYIQTFLSALNEQNI